MKFMVNGTLPQQHLLSGVSTIFVARAASHKEIERTIARFRSEGHFADGIVDGTVTDALF